MNFRFPLNNLRLLWPVDTKPGVLVAYIKRRLGTDTLMYVIMVKVTVPKRRNSVLAEKF